MINQGDYTSPFRQLLETDKYVDGKQKKNDDKIMEYLYNIDTTIDKKRPDHQFKTNQPDLYDILMQLLAVDSLVDGSQEDGGKNFTIVDGYQHEHTKANRIQWDLQKELDACMWSDPKHMALLSMDVLMSSSPGTKNKKFKSSKKMSESITTILDLLAVDQEIDGHKNNKTKQGDDGYDSTQCALQDMLDIDNAINSNKNMELLKLDSNMEMRDNYHDMMNHVADLVAVDQQVDQGQIGNNTSNTILYEIFSIDQEIKYNSYKSSRKMTANITSKIKSDELKTSLTSSVYEYRTLQEMYGYENSEKQQQKLKQQQHQVQILLQVDHLIDGEASSLWSGKRQLQALYLIDEEVEKLRSIKKNAKKTEKLDPYMSILMNDQMMAGYSNPHHYNQYSPEQNHESNRIKNAYSAILEIDQQINRTRPQYKPTAKQARKKVNVHLERRAIFTMKEKEKISLQIGLQSVKPLYDIDQQMNQINKSKASYSTSTSTAQIMKLLLDVDAWADDQMNLNSMKLTSNNTRMHPSSSSGMISTTSSTTSNKPNKRRIFTDLEKNMAKMSADFIRFQSEPTQESRDSNFRQNNPNNNTIYHDYESYHKDGVSVKNLKQEKKEGCLIM